MSLRIFKFLVVAFVAVIFLISATRQRIADTVLVVPANSQKSFFDKVRDKYSAIIEVDIHNSSKINIEPSFNDDFPEDTQQEEQAVEEDDDTQVPFDDTMPGAYLRFMEPAPVNRSHCKFNYEFPYDLVYTKNDYLFPPQLGKESEYRIIYNITEAHGIENVSQVTYATHMTANFAYFIPELLRQWDGLITVAAFVPDLDCAFFLEQINQFCYCEPEMHRVSIHIATHKLLAFSKKDINFDRPDNCIPQDSSKLGIVKEYDETIIYPVNVVRNVARTSALTKYVLLSDIELMPSKDLASGFLKMLEHYNKTNPKEVFVVPIFEVEEIESIPENKEELLKLLDVQKAVYFHELICKHCQKFPGIENWTASGYLDNIQPLVTVKRHEPYNRWEPIFIGTNEEPLYSEQLSWEGFQDKMTQSLEMCLQNYDYTILDNAFLCHWPGIKKHKITDEEWRENFVKQNAIAYKEIIQKLQERYDDIPECQVQHIVEILPKKKNKTELVKIKVVTTKLQMKIL